MRAPSCPSTPSRFCHVLEVAPQARIPRLSGNAMVLDTLLHEPSNTWRGTVPDRGRAWAKFGPRHTPSKTRLNPDRRHTPVPRRPNHVPASRSIVLAGDRSRLGGAGVCLRSQRHMGILGINLYHHLVPTPPAGDRPCLARHSLRTNGYLDRWAEQPKGPQIPHDPKWDERLQKYTNLVLGVEATVSAMV